MFDYIKKQFSEQMDLFEEHTAENDDTELVVECAHLFEELSDLSVEGDDSRRERRISIDIPLEDDIEIDSIEFNMSDSRITDVPMDATVQEALTRRMKTYEDFYQEACSNVVPFVRESATAYENRKQAYVKKEMSKYHDYIVQEGLFGFGMIDIDNDPRVPCNKNVDLGPCGKDGKHYYVSLPVYFQIQKKGKITKKQLDSINMLPEDALVTIGGLITDMLIDKYPEKMKGVDNIWDTIMTPIKLSVPIEPVDKYAVIIVLRNEIEGTEDRWSWKKPIKSGGSNHGKMEKVDSNEVKELFSEKFQSKREFLRESHEIRRPSRFGSFYQEAIDFGGVGDIDVNTTNDSPSNDTTEPTVDNKVDAGANPVDTNDVSDQIAEKVSTETNDTTTDVSSEPPVDAKLEDINDNGNMELGLNDDTELTEPTTSSKLDDGNSIDISNMTIDELLAQGSEKLKRMTIDQLKTFLNGTDDISMNSTSSLQEAFIDGSSSDVYQEAMILTKKNINNEIDVHLKTALGILNDDKMELNEIILAFKKEGKKLNRILSKATRMSAVYPSEDRVQLQKLNKCLVDIMVSFNASDTAVAKRLIKAFTDQSKVISKIIEDKQKERD